MQPENALNSWSQWNGAVHSRPVIVRPLSGGRSNRSFLLDSNGNRMVLRLNGANALLPSADRSNEFNTWQAASKQGIAPPLLYVDKDANYLVSTYIENHLPPQPQLDKTVVDQALSLLNRCHQLNIKAPHINYASHIRQYWNIIDNKPHLDNPSLIDQREPMQATLEALITSNTPTALCHHDPVIANFVGSAERLYLIDWEYAAKGLLVMDYAALGIEWGLDNVAIQEKTGIEPELLNMAKSLYKYLCELWNLLRT